MLIETRHGEPRHGLARTGAASQATEEPRLARGSLFLPGVRQGQDTAPATALLTNAVAEAAPAASPARHLPRIPVPTSRDTREPFRARLPLQMPAIREFVSSPTAPAEKERDCGFAVTTPLTAVTRVRICQVS